jgi:hypothetical protein
LLCLASRKRPFVTSGSRPEAAIDQRLLWVPSFSLPFAIAFVGQPTASLKRQLLSSRLM